MASLSGLTRPLTRGASTAPARLRRAAMAAATLWILAVALGWWIADPRPGLFVAAAVVLAATGVHVNGIIGADVARRDELQRDLQAARRIQQSLLPSSAPAVQHAEFAMACRMCRDVGGDCVDAVVLDDHRLALFVGDVSGKGIAAALVMSGLQAAFRTMVVAGTPLAGIASALDRLLLERGSERYATGILLTLDTRAARIEYVNAGHLPLLVHSSSHTTMLDATGPPLGLLPGIDRPSTLHELPSGSTLVLVTDGITERMQADTEFGIQGVHSTLDRSGDETASAVVTRILDDCQAHAGGAPVEDDMTVVVVKVSVRAPCA